MGIPSFYRWLSERFPLCVVDAVSQHYTKKSVMEVEFDNLYLDMNGIIHPCFHPEGKQAPTSYEDVFVSIFEYIDKIYSIVRPRKLLYLAIDGVAPRAKMNQQRSRRFRAAKDSEEEAAKKGSGQKKVATNVGLGIGSEFNEKSTPLDKLDSNVITPGTEFMALLSTALRYYICLRMNSNPLWKGIKVILSDSSVAGEGEHKIMSYIRLQRNLPGYDPNTRHCMYGLDADLIMLALATHEIHFSILREKVQKPPAPNHSKSRTRLSRKKKTEWVKGALGHLNFQFIHVWILREYLQYAMKIPDRTLRSDLERLIDDFVFMCLFVGNDFLPHMPSLEISKGAIDMLMEIYKREFVRMGGYLTNSCEVHLGRVQHFLLAVADHEAVILRRLDMETGTSKEGRHSKCSSVRNVGQRPVGEDSVKSPSIEIQAPNSSSSVSTNTEVDKIEFRDCWKERYYTEKFEVENEEDRERIRNDLVLKYTEGMCWVMHYYYGGVCSWQWFYPYHYAPFASDCRDIGKLEIQFTLGEPFKPFDQLMAVLPAASGHALPLSYRMLMTDPSSPLLPFYPKDFELDMNGKRFSWQAICKLPFIEESLLLSEIAKVEHTLTDEERQRNSLGLDILFVYNSHSLAGEIVSFYERNVGDPELAKFKLEQLINPELSDGMNGYMIISDKHVQPTEIDSPICHLKTIANNQALSVFYKFPSFHAHIPRLPEGVQLPPKTICKKDIQPTPLLLHESSAVVGRLHSLRPIPNSISGSRISEWAHQLVLTWYRGIPQERKQSLERSKGASVYGNPCNENAKSVFPDHIGGGREPIKTTTKKRKRPRTKKQNNGGELCVTETVTNKPESVSSTEVDQSASVVKLGSGSELSDAVVVENEPASTPLPSGSSVSKKRKRVRKRKAVANGMLAVSSMEVDEPGSVAKIEVALSAAENEDGNHPKELNNAEMLTNKPEYVSGSVATVSISNAGVDEIRASELLNTQEVDGMVAVSSREVAEPVSIAKSESTFSSAGSEDGNQPKVMNNGSELCDTIGFANESACTPLPGGNSVTTKRKRKTKAVANKLTAISGTQVHEPGSVVKLEEKNGGELCDTGTVINKPESVSSVVATVGVDVLRVRAGELRVDGTVAVSSAEVEAMLSFAGNEHDNQPKELNNWSELCDTVVVEKEPESTPLSSGSSVSRKKRRKKKAVANGIVAVPSTEVDEPDLIAKSEASLSSAENEGDNRLKAQNNDGELCDAIASTPLPSGNSVSKKRKRVRNKEVVANGIVAVSSTEVDEPGSVAKLEVVLSPAENEDGNHPKQLNDVEMVTNKPEHGSGLVANVSISNAGVDELGATGLLDTQEVAIETSSSTLPSGNSTSKKRRRKKKSVANGVVSVKLTEEEQNGTETGTNRSVSIPLPSGDSTSTKLKRKKKKRKNIENGVCEPSDDKTIPTGSALESAMAICPDDRSGENMLSCHLGPEKCNFGSALKGEQTVGVESKTEAMEKDGMVHVGGTETGGDGSVGKLSKIKKNKLNKKRRMKKKISLEKAIAVLGKNVGEVDPNVNSNAVMV